MALIQSILDSHEEGTTANPLLLQVPPSPSTPARSVAAELSRELPSVTSAASQGFATGAAASSHAQGPVVATTVTTRVGNSLPVQPPGHAQLLATSTSSLDTQVAHHSAAPFTSLPLAHGTHDVVAPRLSDLTRPPKFTKDSDPY